MGPIIFGIKETPIDIDEYLVRCPSCEGYSLADILVISKYYHFYWIPFFPTEKDANVICKSCGLKRYDMAFDAGLITNYNEVKGKYKHPWFTYIGLTIMILIFTAILLSSIL